MGNVSALIQNNPDILARLQGAGITPRGSGMGVLSMLPQSHQQAATARPPIPGGDFDKLGSFSQQALGMAGVQPPPPPTPPPPPSGGFPNPGGRPPGFPPIPGGPPQGFPAIPAVPAIPGGQQPVIPGPPGGQQPVIPGIPGGMPGKGSPFGGAIMRDVPGLLARANLR